MSPLFQFLVATIHGIGVVYQKQKQKRCYTDPLTSAPTTKSLKSISSTWNISPKNPIHLKLDDYIKINTKLIANINVCLLVIIHMKENNCTRCIWTQVLRAECFHYLSLIFRHLPPNLKKIHSWTAHPTPSWLPSHQWSRTDHYLNQRPMAMGMPHWIFSVLGIFSTFTHVIKIVKLEV